MPYWEVNIHCRGNERQSDKIEHGTASTKARIAFLAAILRSIELCGREQVIKGMLTALDPCPGLISLALHFQNH